MKSLQKFDPAKIEKKWQKIWEKEGVYTPDIEKSKNKFYNLWMFPYPSAEGLHAGHAFASTGGDVIGRFKRMNGKNVFQPIGYDSFGLHSENFAIKTASHPRKLIDKTTKYYAEQLSSLGHGYDWTRTVTTSDIEYYRWTQWIFVQLFKAGYAYRKQAEVNWCPSCKTVLADEQVMTPKQAEKEPRDKEGNVVKDTGELRVCERCGTIVERKLLAQWFFRITDYADKLLEGLEKIDWPEKIKTAQRNWIGKKEGIIIKYPVLNSKFQIPNSKFKVECWTSRPDTNFGATFIVVSPEYAQKNLIKVIEHGQRKEVEKYIKDSLNKSKEDRIKEGRRKTGVFTGLYALNQLNDYQMPIWVADFVLYEVGTGAVVGVPGHDRRDFEFAKEFDLAVKRVVVGSDGDKSDIAKIEQVREEEGTMINSGFLNGLDSQKAILKMMNYLKDKGWGRRQTSYHLRDWIISRQRYWGTPIPMIFCENCASEGRSYFTNKGGESLRKGQSDWEAAGWWPEENLPVELPNIKDYKPKGTGSGPLADHPEFYEVSCPECGKTARRETDVSDTFLDSAWYFLRYPSTRSARSGQVPFDPEITKKWLPVDLYFGGAEHAVLHLMYARFITMVLNDLKHINFGEPFPCFFAHGLMIKDGAKMSKSRGNVVNPDEYIEKYGADSLRLYLMFMGPMDGYPDFRDTGIEGMKRFIERVWNLFALYNDVVLVEEKDSEEVYRKLHQTIKKVTKDIQEFRYNTAIAAIMELVNLLREKTQGKIKRAKEGLHCAEWDEAIKVLVQLLAPFAPHMTEELWVNVLGEKFSIHISKWPEYDQDLAKEDFLTIVIQINGKLRDQLSVERSQRRDKDELVKLATSVEKVKRHLKGKKVKDIIFVPGRLINFVLG